MHALFGGKNQWRGVSLSDAACSNSWRMLDWIAVDRSGSDWSTAACMVMDRDRQKENTVEKIYQTTLLCHQPRTTEISSDF